MIDASSSSSSANSSSLFSGPRGRFVISDLVTSFLALVGNSLILAALIRTKLTVGGYRRFLLSLLAADIFMATTSMMAVGHQYFQNSEYFQSSIAFEQCGSVVLRSLTLVSYFASLLSIAGLTIDNFIGVFFELHYRHLMRGRRLKTVVIIIWLLSFLLGFTDPFVALVNHGFAKLLSQQHTTTDKPIIMPPSTTPVSSAPQRIIDEAPHGSTHFEDYFEEEDQPPPNVLATAKPALQEIQFQKNYDSSEYSFDSKIEPHMQDLQIRSLITDVLSIVEMQRGEHQFCRIFRVGVEKFAVEFFVIGLTMPCFVLLLVIYCCIFIKVLRRRNISDSFATKILLPLTPTMSNSVVAPSTTKTTKRTNCNNSEFNRHSARLALTTLMLISSFVCCWMSFIMFELFVFLTSRLDQTLAKNEKLLLLNSIFNSMLMLSPLVNPIIYAVRLPRVRQQLIRILACKCRASRSYYAIQMFVTAAARAPLLTATASQDPSSTATTTTIIRRHQDSLQQALSRTVDIRRNAEHEINRENFL